MLHGTIFGTVFYLAAFIACVINVYRFRKSCKPMNGFIWLILSFLSAVCMGSIVAGVISIVRIPVNLYSMAVIYAFIALVVSFFIRRDGMKQEYVWENLTSS